MAQPKDRLGFLVEGERSSIGHVFNQNTNTFYAISLTFNGTAGLKEEDVLKSDSLPLPYTFAVSAMADKGKFVNLF
jgi:hypothetical protein